MNLLLINFEMDPNSRVLAWQYYVACELAKASEKIVVLTERSGRFDHPANMEIYTVPLWFVKAPLRLLGAKWLMNLPMYRLFKGNCFEACLIHMNMEWTYRLYPCFRLFRVPVLLWYAHGTLTRRLFLAHKCATRVVTSTPEGFRIPSSKLRVIGQGVDTKIFDLQEIVDPQTDIIAVGRISRRKRVQLMLEVMDCLRRLQPAARFKLRLIGTPLTREDSLYAKELKRYVNSRGLQEYVDFVGYVPVISISQYYSSAFLHLNVSKTGSMDKTVLEALACGCPVLTSNEAFIDLLSRDYPEFIIRDDWPEAITQQVLELYSKRAKVNRPALRKLVVGQHDLSVYVRKLLENLEEISSQA